MVSLFFNDGKLYYYELRIYIHRKLEINCLDFESIEGDCPDRIRHLTLDENGLYDLSKFHPRNLKTLTIMNNPIENLDSFSVDNLKGLGIFASNIKSISKI